MDCVSFVERRAAPSTHTPFCLGGVTTDISWERWQCKHCVLDSVVIREFYRSFVPDARGGIPHPLTVDWDVQLFSSNVVQASEAQ